ncbi:hypothetical protein SASPL_105089 [Salvia splendens]|uniref:Uncharacterized protein n=1 Tax=Salvia splendens TaxID=180675 RepID=A0A8X8YNZ1_SALSN|nr:hypothetical protein SASPL_105089 [Salvia splendens]
MLIQFLRDHQIPKIYRGSVPGHSFINRDREGAHARLCVDDFVDNPLYNGTMFCKRFWMSLPLFLRIVDTVKEHDDCFMQRSDGTRRLGLSSIQKVVSKGKPESDEQTLVPTIEEAWRRCRRCPSRDPTCSYTPNTTHTPPCTLCLRKYASTSQPMMHGISDSGAQTNDPKHAPLDTFPTQHGTNERGVAV